MGTDSVFKIYDNSIGISFQWKKNAKLTQVIFRDTGFHLSKEEIVFFLEEIQLSKQKKTCKTCSLGTECRSMLLKTPFYKVSMAVSLTELNAIEDLLRGTLFQLDLNEYLQELCKN